ncbi:MAG: tyrosine--tRNA ligase [Actinomycetota bacterium]
MAVPASEQLRILSSGAAAIIPEDEFRKKLERSAQTGEPLRVKLGIDPSTPDIHIGHAVPLRKMRRFQELGHTAVLIIGDFTGQVGDPSGQSATRKALTPEAVAENATTYVDQARRILLPERLEVRHNSEWLGTMGIEGLLRLAGQATVAQILERDDFRKRYDGGLPISVVEFLYPLLQGQDSVEIRSDVELGGTDQTFNLLVGRDLQGRAGQDPQVAFTLPLLEGLDGVQKMSKSLGNYVGIAEPPEEMFGKLMSVPDRLVGKYFRLATDLDPEEIETLEREASDGGPAASKVKRRLAKEIVGLYHGADAAVAAERRFDQVHVAREVPKDIPTASIPAAAVADGVVHLPAVMVALGLASSTSKARDQIKQGGVRLDGEPVTELDVPFEGVDGRVLQAGRRNFRRLSGVA